MNFTSNPIKVFSEVPQGSHLSPLLFLMYINDLPNVIKQCQCLLYADDVKLVYDLENSNEALKIQKDFNNLV